MSSDGSPKGEQVLKATSRRPASPERLQKRKHSTRESVVDSAVEDYEKTAPSATVDAPSYSGPFYNEKSSAQTEIELNPAKPNAELNKVSKLTKPEPPTKTSGFLAKRWKHILVVICLLCIFLSQSHAILNSTSKVMSYECHNATLAIARQKLEVLTMHINEIPDKPGKEPAYDHVAFRTLKRAAEVLTRQNIVEKLSDLATSSFEGKVSLLASRARVMALISNAQERMTEAERKFPHKADLSMFRDDLTHELRAEVSSCAQHLRSLVGLAKDVVASPALPRLQRLIDSRANERRWFFSNSAAEQEQLSDLQSDMKRVEVIPSAERLLELVDRVRASLDDLLHALWAVEDVIILL